MKVGTGGRAKRGQRNYKNPAVIASDVALNTSGAFSAWLKAKHTIFGMARMGTKFSQTWRVR